MPDSQPLPAAMGATSATSATQYDREQTLRRTAMEMGAAAVPGCVCALLAAAPRPDGLRRVSAGIAGERAGASAPEAAEHHAS